MLAGAICAALTERGERVAAVKPVATGLDERPAGWPADHELLAEVASAGQTPEDVATHRFGPALSPHYAAELAGVTIDPDGLVASARGAGSVADAVVVEGVGGLMTPLAKDYLVRDLAAELSLPILIAARTGLGTISHSLLTLEAARAAGLWVAATVMTPWPADPQPIELSNRLTVERLGKVDVVGLSPTTPKTLARAGAELPLDDWL